MRGRSGTLMILTGLIGLAGCAANTDITQNVPASATETTRSSTQASSESAVPESQWQKRATENDKRRLEKWDEAFDLGKLGALKAGHEDDIKARAPLFELQAALPDGTIPAGLYSCSVTKLSEQGRGGLPYIAYPEFRCRVTDMDGRKQFTKLTGSQRTSGWIYQNSGRDAIYLGSGFYGYEDSLTPYGESQERDEAAVVQRIAANRWRMVFPFPYYESTVNVMELTPIKEKQ